MRMTRDWISMQGSSGKQRTTLLFTLRNPALVGFVVVQVAPDCRRIGSFRVRGHRGVNRVRLDNRIGRHVLGPGTYELVTRPHPNTRKVTATRLVVVRGSTRREIRAARSAFACPTAPSSVYKVAFGPTGTLPARPPDKPRGQHQAKPKRHTGVLGKKFGRALLSGVDDVPIWVYGLLAVAVGLLGAAAALPKAQPRGLSASLLAGSVGAAILLGLTIAYSLG